jgi:bifunctional non-homologous end joining protein LigD
VSASFVAFDLMALDGEDLRQRRLEEWREALSRLIAGVDGLVFSEAIAAEGALVFAKACELGCDGIVSKRIGSRYWSGPSRDWFKTKNPAFSGLIGVRDARQKA